MAQRRMFSLKIINSAKFLKMPVDSQNLYFHLGIRADDDGIVEAYTAMRLIGSPEDNLKLLEAKGFVRVLNADLVTYITDWNEHNHIRADRKVDSIYKNLLIEILPDVELQEPKPRSDRPKKSGTSQCQPMDGIGKVRLDLGKVNEEPDHLPIWEQLKNHWNMRAQSVTLMTPFQRLCLTGAKQSEILRTIGAYGLDICTESIDNISEMLMYPGKFDVFQAYTDFETFLKSGVDKFRTAARPTDKFAIVDKFAVKVEPVKDDVFEVCPACGGKIRGTMQSCGRCGLSKDEWSRPELVEESKQLWIKKKENRNE